MLQTANHVRYYCMDEEYLKEQERLIDMKISERERITGQKDEHAASYKELLMWKVERGVSKFKYIGERPFPGVYEFGVHKPKETKKEVKKDEQVRKQEIDDFLQEMVGEDFNF